MGAVFWIKRFVTVFAGVFVIVCLSQLRKGHDLGYALSEAAIWSAVAAAVFTGERLWQSRRGQHCAICNDTPEMRQEAGSPDTKKIRSDTMTLAPYIKTFALVALVLFFALPKGGGTWFGVALLLFIAWALYSIVRLMRKPAERRMRAIRLAIWSAALVLAGATQVHWRNATREQASAVAAALASLKSRTGAYPASLEEAGVNGQALQEEWGVAYRLRDGKPELSYPASVMPLTQYEYDFDARKWTTNAY